MNTPISLVLLVHNEAEIIEHVVRDFYTKIVEKIPHSEIIVAEDGSTDGTKEILHRLSHELPAFRLEEGKKKRGYVRAFKDAMSLPKNDLILFCDSSGKYEPNDFWKMYELIQHYDMVIGYKKKRQDPYYRVFLTRVFNFLVNRYFGTSFRDIDCPFRLMRKSAFDVIAQEAWIQKALINFELTVRMHAHRFRLYEVPIRHFSRKNGSSRGLPFSKIPGVVWQTLRNFPVLRKELNLLVAGQMNVGDVKS